MKIMYKTAQRAVPFVIVFSRLSVKDDAKVK